MEEKLNKSATYIIFALFAACGVFFLVEACSLAYNKFFTIDEFQYAHAAWLYAQGMIPYRDFFDHHFPFLYQLFSIFFIFSNDPMMILFLRGGMVVFLILDLAAIWIINSKFSSTFSSSILSLVFLLCCWPFITRAIEIRPDGIAFSLFIASLAPLYFYKNKLNIPPLRRFIFPFIGGIALVLAVWASQKVLVYGAPLALFLLADLISFHKKKGLNLFSGHPYYFLSGSVLIGVLILGYLLFTGSLGLMWRWCFIFPAEMQQGFVGFSWAKHFFPGFGWYFWAIPLFWVGWSSSLIKLKGRWCPIDCLLLFLPLTTFISYFIQIAPYDYSLIPFYGICALFVGRGGGIILDKMATSQKLPQFLKNCLISVFPGVLVIAILLNIRFFARFNEDNNRYQLKVLREINDLTDENEVFFDNTGNFITRSHAYYFYYNCQYMRDNWQKQFVKEIPQALIDSQCTWFFEDYRVSELPPMVLRFLKSNFVRYSPDLWVWGKKMAGQGKFYAVKSGDYFLYPDGIYKESEIRIGKNKIKTQIFHLAKGIYDVSSNRKKEFYIIYLPADGHPFKPEKKGGISTFVR